MIDVDHRSPVTDPLGARREVGERATAPHSTARSLHLTWEEFCDRYKPGLYAHRSTTTAATIARDVDTLLDVLNGAHYRLGHLARYLGSIERTSAGSCYGNAA